MKQFLDFISEKAEEPLDHAEAKKALMGLISSNFFRFANSNNGDDRPLLMLIAALGVVSASTDLQSLNIARRLATGAVSRSATTKK